MLDSEAFGYLVKYLKSLERSPYPLDGSAVGNWLAIPFRLDYRLWYLIGPCLWALVSLSQSLSLSV